MPELVSMIQPATTAYNKNRASMLGYVDQLRALEQRAVDASSKRNATFEKPRTVTAYRAPQASFGSRHAFLTVTYVG